MVKIELTAVLFAASVAAKYLSISKAILILSKF
jgi:hypothetical protein